jgi:hypothetical protein
MQDFFSSFLRLYFYQSGSICIFSLMSLYLKAFKNTPSIFFRFFPVFSVSVCALFPAACAAMSAQRAKTPQ